MAAFAKASRWDDSRKTPGLLSLQEEPGDIHLYYPKSYKQQRAVTGSHMALAKSEGVPERKEFSPTRPKPSEEPVSVFQPSAETEGKWGSAPHTHTELVSTMRCYFCCTLLQVIQGTPVS